MNLDNFLAFATWIWNKGLMKISFGLFESAWLINSETTFMLWIVAEIVNNIPNSHSLLLVI